jgi:hypothetical protein
LKAEFLVEQKEWDREHIKVEEEDVKQRAGRSRMKLNLEND